MLIYLDIKIPHLQIAHLGGNLEVGNIKIYLCQKCTPPKRVFPNCLAGYFPLVSLYLCNNLVHQLLFVPKGGVQKIKMEI